MERIFIGRGFLFDDEDFYARLVSESELSWNELLQSNFLLSYLSFNTLSSLTLWSYPCSGQP